MKQDEITVAQNLTKSTHIKRKKNRAIFQIGHTLLLIVRDKVINEKCCYKQ